MEIKDAQFVMSNSDYRKCPTPNLPEYAFIGRSNVGKSSLINAITNRNSLAKTSGKPGKTQLINHFLIDKAWYLVDLPGYGYAAVSKVKRAMFHEFIREYLLERPNLMCTFVLLDSRLEPQKIDLEFMQWLGENGIPFVMVFTKTDKLNSTKLRNNMKTYQAKMLEFWEEFPTAFYTSSVSKQGTEDILSFVEETNGLFEEK
jgi:GTP-binding protein